jgi:hypothetical protein
MEKASHPHNAWTEVEPAIFERKGLSREEFAKWDQRPDDFIKSALRSSAQVENRGRQIAASRELSDTTDEKNFGR